MKKIALLYLFLCMLLCKTIAQKHDFIYINTQSPVENPLHEMRAVWLTTIGGIDWPHSYSQSAYSAKKQQEEFCNILDNLVASGINTVLMQTRIRATTIFQSDLEPWDGCLSGFPGKGPGYDALDFAITECHKRGMKFHAWVVTIPVGKWNGVGCKNLRNTCPHLLKKIGDEGFMNPEHSGTAIYLSNFCSDIVKRYDVDGIHLDYLRYPDIPKGVKSPFTGSADFRRSNITRIASEVSKVVKSIKPWVMMSCSPVGKYADTKRQWSHGWNARDVVYQDAVDWLHSGNMDALFPMMYFRNENFYPFAIDWKERSGGKIITPGLGIYFLSPKEKNWSLDDITREMHVLRQYDMGVCMFRSKFLTDNTKGLYDYTKTLFSYQPSLQPIMSWYDVVPPLSPDSLKVINTYDNETVLSWNDKNGEYSPNGGMTYNLYGASSMPVDIKDSKNLLAANLQQNTISFTKPPTVNYFAVTTTDRYGNESKPIYSYNVKDDVDVLNTGDNVVGRKFLPYDGLRILLNDCDVSAGQLITISTLQGVDVFTRIVSCRENKFFIDVRLPIGHYNIYLINKKGNRHNIGTVMVSPK